MFFFFPGVKELQTWTAESYTDVSFGEMSPDWLKQAKEHLETNLTHMYTDLELKDRKGEGIKRLGNIMQLFDDNNLSRYDDRPRPHSGSVRIGVLGTNLSSAASILSFGFHLHLEGPFCFLHDDSPQAVFV